MASTLHLSIVSAEKEIFSGLAEMIVATGELGEIGVVSGHAPLLTILKPGEIRVTLPNQTAPEVYYVSGGMLEIQPDCVTVLADMVERAESLDEAAALAAKARAEEAMVNKDADLDYSLAAAELARAVAQIRAIHRVRKMIR